MEGVDRRSRFGSDLVGDGDRAHDVAVVDDVEDGAAAVAPRRDLVGEPGGLVEVEVVEQRWPADGDMVSVDRRGDATAGDRVELRRRRHVAELVADGDDRTGDRVLAVGLGGGGQAHHPVRVPTLDGGTVDDGVVALGEGAGLVEEDDIDGAHPLQGEAILDEDPGPGRRRGGDRDHQRDGEAEGVGAGDDQHRDGADDTVGGVSHRRPDQHRDQGGGGRDVEQRRRGTVRQRLGS